MYTVMALIRPYNLDTVTTEDRAHGLCEGGGGPHCYDRGRLRLECIVFSSSSSSVFY